MNKRFIDYAEHGGCSKKTNANDLTSMLDQIGEGNSYLSDVGFFEHDDFTAVSSVDVILPMVNSAKDFGVITVSHILNDLYSSYAKPQYCLATLGIPKGLDAKDKTITTIMSSAIDTLKKENIKLVGGHTLSNLSELFFGLTAIGHLEKNMRNNTVDNGDSIILTKPLGSSLATTRWKTSDKYQDMHTDVLQSMKLLNNYPAKLAKKYNLPYGTDISGFGFIGHLHNLMKSYSVNATIQYSKLPIFNSIKNICNDEIFCTRLYSENYKYYSKFLETKVSLTNKNKYILYDSNVSGALILIVPNQIKNVFINKLLCNGYSASIIGTIQKNNSTIGKIILES